jgi:hypothetical protein
VVGVILVILAVLGLIVTVLQALAEWRWPDLKSSDGHRCRRDLCLYPHPPSDARLR